VFVATVTWHDSNAHGICRVLGTVDGATNYIPAMLAPPRTAALPPLAKPAASIISLAWSLLASIPMLRAMARTTVGPPPRNRPATPSSRTIRVCNHSASKATDGNNCCCSARKPADCRSAKQHRDSHVAQKARCCSWNKLHNTWVSTLSSAAVRPCCKRRAAITCIITVLFNAYGCYQLTTRPLRDCTSFDNISSSAGCRQDHQDGFSFKQMQATLVLIGVAACSQPPPGKPTPSLPHHGIHHALVVPALLHWQGAVSLQHTTRHTHHTAHNIRSQPVLRRAHGVCI